MRQAARIVLLCSALGLLLGGGCYQVPVTGRAAMNMVSDQEVIKQSLAAFNEMKKKYPASRNRDFNERVQRVGEHLSKVAFWDVPGADWEFIVFDVPQQINAFAMAGGKVGVFSGLFKIVQNDDQLASVLAHEIGHVTAHHTHERLSQQMALQSGGLLVGMATGGGGTLSSAAILEAYGLSSGLTAVSFDRKKEAEADHIGMMYMARAGYNPEEAIKVIENLERENAGKPSPSSFLSNHPSNPERILQMMDLMPKALAAYQQSGRNQTPVLVR